MHTLALHQPTLFHRTHTQVRTRTLIFMLLHSRPLSHPRFVLKYTKPKPFDFPVRRSLMTVVRAMGPHCSTSDDQFDMLKKNSCTTSPMFTYVIGTNLPMSIGARIFFSVRFIHFNCPMTLAICGTHLTFLSLFFSSKGVVRSRMTCQYTTVHKKDFISVCKTNLLPLALDTGFGANSNQRF